MKLFFFVRCVFLCGVQLLHIVDSPSASWPSLLFFSHHLSHNNIILTFSSLKAPNNVASLDFDLCACDSHAVYAPSFTLTPDPVVITQILTKPACRKSTRRGYGP